MCEPARDLPSAATESRATWTPKPDRRFGYGQDPAVGAATRFGQGVDPAVGRATQLRGSGPTHGARRYQQTGALPSALAAQQADDYAQLVTDLGGPAQLTTARRVLVEKTVEVLTLTRLYAGDLGRRGPFTPRGRVRATTTGYLAAVDRLVRLLGLLGLERVPKDALTLDQYLASRYGDRRNEPTEGATRPADASRSEAEAQAEGEDDRASQGNVAAQDGDEGGDDGGPR